MSAATMHSAVFFAPPNMMFSAPPSRKLFTILNGPGPFQQQIAWESAPWKWHSLIHESITAVERLLIVSPRWLLSRGLPWM